MINMTGQKGYTLLEAMVGVGIMALIVVAISTSVIVLMKNHGLAAGQSTALPHVQNAGFWISRDFQGSRNITASAPNGFPLSLAMPVDQYSANDHRLDYTINGTVMKRLLYDASQTLLSDTLVAEHIASDNTSFVVVDNTTGLYRLTVTAGVGQEAVTRQYQVSKRLSASLKE
jgi:hypothetical protein